MKTNCSTEGEESAIREPDGDMFIFYTFPFCSTHGILIKLNWFISLNKSSNFLNACVQLHTSSKPITHCSENGNIIEEMFWYEHVIIWSYFLCYFLLCAHTFRINVFKFQSSNHSEIMIHLDDILYLSSHFQIKNAMNSNKK